ncbi:MAG TPA: sugar phosphate isomerase/epimerase [Pseudonocardiaceae bacterium]|nr:sugar phosphate isomerase/epimerase [Pseudonocardiaceae bacterium]
MAAELGYDGVEVMVWADPASQDARALGRLADQHRMPVLAVHAPCLLVSQRVWSADPVVRLRRAVTLATELAAPTVVVHPPFRWQRGYADGFAELLTELEDDAGVALAVENMFTVAPLPRQEWRVSAYRPSIDPTDVGHRHYTIDLSHTAAAGMDALELAKRMGGGLTHVHLADGSGAPRDEHLVPGRGSQPCDRLCASLTSNGFAGQVIVEISTRRAPDRLTRLRDLADSLRFARRNLGY